MFIWLICWLLEARWRCCVCRSRIRQPSSCGLMLVIALIVLIILFLLAVVLSRVATQ